MAKHFKIYAAALTVVGAAGAYGLVDSVVSSFVGQSAAMDIHYLHQGSFVGPLGGVYVVEKRGNDYYAVLRTEDRSLLNPARPGNVCVTIYGAGINDFMGRRVVVGHNLQVHP